MPNPGNLPVINLLYQGSRGWQPVPLTHSATIVYATGTTDVFQIDGYSYATAFLGVSAASGTLTVYIQQLMPDRITWNDYATFNAVTTATDQVMGLVSAGNAIYSVTNLQNVAGTIRTIPLGTQWRWCFVIPTASLTGPSSFTYTAGVTFYG